jgi:2-polyprenyl-6-hydroxyphenyl methylase/3-demethylubiquinone-9 3-methyltransferase
MSNDPANPSAAKIPEYGYCSQRGHHADHVVGYLMAPIERFLPPFSPGFRALDLGCGDGFWAGILSSRGARVIGVDPSEQGVAVAREKCPAARFERMEATADLLPNLGESPFDLVLSTEVVEHVYLPRVWAAACMKALKPGGRLICSTPYHGYLKNLALSLTNHWDRHASPLWDGGHIKLWSRRTLSTLLDEAGFVNIRFAGAGRIPFLWKSMVLCADRPR